ncbi:MAG TPA: hypothetical protein VEK08_24890 [Planctomycetota bacterium]|nr:hypothetical protein [Planctomycetota bacterium]
MDSEDLESIRRLEEQIFECARTGSREDVMALGCPRCGAPLAVFWMRQLVPVIGMDALNMRCTKTGCCFLICTDGKIPRPSWAGFFSGTLTTAPKSLKVNQRLGP